MATIKYKDSQGEWQTVDISGGAYVLPTASETVKGGVKIGDGLSVEDDGTVSAVIKTFVLEWFNVPTEEQKQHIIETMGEIESHGYSNSMVFLKKDVQYYTCSQYTKIGYMYSFYFISYSQNGYYKMIRTGNSIISLFQAFVSQVDEELSPTSENPVRNSAVYNALYPPEAQE